MAKHTDYDWLTTRERNLKKTKKDTRREMDIDIDGLPQESNGGYDMVGKQSPSDKNIISPVAHRTNRSTTMNMPKWIEKAANIFVGKKIGEEKIVTASEKNPNLSAVDAYLDKNRIHLNEFMYTSLLKKAEAVTVNLASDFNTIGKMVKEVYDEALHQAQTPQPVEKTAGKYDYTFTANIAKAQKSQVKQTASGYTTLAECISDIAAKMKTEVTSDEIQDVTKQVQNEISKRRHASNDDITSLVVKAVEVIAAKKTGVKLAHNGIRTTVDQIKLEAAQKVAIASTLEQNKVTKVKAEALSEAAKKSVKEAAERMTFPKNKVTVQKQVNLPEGYQKKEMDEGKEISTPATKQAEKLFQKIVDQFSVIAEIEEKVKIKIEEIKKEEGLQKEVEKMEAAVTDLATLAGTAHNNAIQIQSKATAAYNYAVLVTHEKQKEEPTEEEIVAEMKKKIPFFDLQQYNEMSKALSESIKSIKAAKGFKLVEKSMPELKIVTKGSLNVTAEEYVDLVSAIETLSAQVSEFNSVMEKDLAEFESVDLGEEVAEEQIAASAKPKLEKKAEADDTYYVEVSLQPSSGGFGEWARHANSHGPYTENEVYGDIFDILNMAKENIDREIYQLGEADVPKEIDDIRGKIHNEPTFVFGYLDENNEPKYFGVDEIGKNEIKGMEKESSWKSTKPPRQWFNEKANEISKGNPDYTDEQVNATVGKIWSDMSEKDKAAKRHSEGKEYGTPKKASLNKLGNDFMLRKAGFPDRYPYIDKCRNCAFFYSGLGTVYDKCVDCIHFYSEPELKDMAKEDISGLGDYFYDKSNKFNVGTPVFNTKHASLKVDATQYNKLDEDSKKLVKETIALENEISSLMEKPGNRDIVNKKYQEYKSQRASLSGKYGYQNESFNEAVKQYMKSNS